MQKENLSGKSDPKWFFSVFCVNNQYIKNKKTLLPLL